MILFHNEWEHFGVKLELRLSRGGIILSGVLEIRNWKWDMGNRKWDMGLGLLKMVNCLKSNNYDCELMENDYLPSISIFVFECELMESDYLLSISYEKFLWVGGGWSEIIASALLLLFLN